MNHAIVVDLGWGDAGKGSTTDYLCETRGYRLVVRYSGGAQAGHRVVRSDGREHVFRQYGSGTFTGAHTALSRYMLVDPLALAKETEMLEAIGVSDPLRLVHVSEDALVTTPLHAGANRREEMARGVNRHGSCGRGIGKTREYAIDYPDDALYVRDLLNPLVTSAKLRLMAGRLTEFGLGAFAFDTDEISQAYQRFTRSVDVLPDAGMIAAFSNEPAVFEGAQGVLLDEKWGFPPYYTWTDTTANKALLMIEEAGLGRGNSTVYGLTRSYATRHGAGPFPTESIRLTRALSDPTNPHNQWQQGWRVGDLDLIALDYAIRACGTRVDELVVSCLDRLSEGMVCVAYALDEDQDSFTTRIPRADTAFLENASPILASTKDIVQSVERWTQTPVTITSYGPTAADKKER